MATGNGALTHQSIGAAVVAPPAAIKIEDGIPIPPKGVGRKFKGYGVSHALRTMEVGQSFATASKHISNHVFLIAKATGRKFMTRRVEENGVRVIRVWRIA